MATLVKSFGVKCHKGMFTANTHTVYVAHHATHVAIFGSYDRY